VATVQSLLRRTPVGRLVRGVPVLRLLAAAEIAVLAKDHLMRLDAPQRRRLIELVRKARGRPDRLSDAEREELGKLVAALEPRLLFADAAGKVSPLPLPERWLYGRGGRAARRGGSGAGKPS
jgi:hypothetical protein